MECSTRFTGRRQATSKSASIAPASAAVRSSAYLAPITAGLGSLKAAYDLAKGMNAANTQATVNNVKIDLQQHILDAQDALAAVKQEQLDATEYIRKLEAEVVRLKDWSSERERYALKKFYPGTLSYVLKPEMSGSEPAHMLCKHCFDQTKKGTLQATSRVDQRYRIFVCSGCKAELPFGEPMPEEADKRLNPHG